MKEIIAGVDIGNDSMKYYDGTQDSLSIMPNVMAESIELEHFEVQQGSLLDFLDVRVESKGQLLGRYFVGKLAEKNPKHIQEMFTGNNKADEKQVMICLLTLLASKAAQSKKQGKIEAAFTLGLGLPIKDYVSSKQELMNKLQGSHKVIFNSWVPQAANQVVILNIENVYIFPEGSAALINYSYSDKGDVTNNEYLEELVGICDIGSQTTDMPVLRNMAVVSDSHLTTSLNDGMAQPLDAIIQRVYREFKGWKFKSRYHLVECITKKNCMITDRGKVHTIRNIVEEEFRRFAGKITNHIHNKWYEEREIRVIFLVGGGAIAMRSYLEADLEEKGYNLYMPELPQYQNAMGFYKAVRILTSTAEV